MTSHLLPPNNLFVWEMKGESYKDVSSWALLLKECLVFVTVAICLQAQAKHKLQQIFIKCVMLKIFFMIIMLV